MATVSVRERLPRDLAIPLGLFVNELVTNAIKYAYPDGAGEIRVTARAAEGGLRLTVCDDGVAREALRARLR